MSLLSIPVSSKYSNYGTGVVKALLLTLCPLSEIYSPTYLSLNIMVLRHSRFYGSFIFTIITIARFIDNLEPGFPMSTHINPLSALEHAWLLGILPFVLKWKLCQLLSVFI